VSAPTLALSCRCGNVRGTARIPRKRALRAICHCDDCQTYALHLGDETIPNVVVDEWGGTEVLQGWPEHITLDAGHEHIRVTRLSPKGLLRFNASCCDTPMANLLDNPKLPFTGLVHTFIADDAKAQLDDAYGRPMSRIQCRFAPTQPPDGVPRAPAGLIAKAAKNMAVGKLKRGHRPHPFFDDDGQPVAQQVEVLSKDERIRLRRKCGPS